MVLTACFYSTVTKSWMSERPTMNMIQLVEYTGSDGQLKQFHLLEKIQAKWKDIGTLMEIENATLSSFAERHRGDLKEQCRDVLQMWLEGGSRSEKYPVTWSGLLEVLKDVQLKVISCELEEVLGKCVSTDQGIVLNWLQGMPYMARGLDHVFASMFPNYLLILHILAIFVVQCSAASVVEAGPWTHREIFNPLLVQHQSRPTVFHTKRVENSFLKFL